MFYGGEPSPGVLRTAARRFYFILTVLKQEFLCARKDGHPYPSAHGRFVNRPYKVVHCRWACVNPTVLGRTWKSAPTSDSQLFMILYKLKTLDFQMQMHLRREVFFRAGCRFPRLL